MLVLDAGAFVAVERGDRDVVALVKRERLSGRAPAAAQTRSTRRSSAWPATVATSLLRIPETSATWRKPQASMWS